MWSVACCLSLSNPRLLIFAARHSQQLPDRAVDSVFKETHGKYMESCKYSIVGDSDDYTVACADVGHLSLQGRFCPIEVRVSMKQDRERSPECTGQGTCKKRGCSTGGVGRVEASGLDRCPGGTRTERSHFPASHNTEQCLSTALPISFSICPEDMDRK